MQVADRFSAMIAALGPLEPSPTLAIALSGGADSMALTLLADRWARASGGSIVALTVDHNLREGSAAEAQKVGAWMHEKKIEHHVLTPHHTPAGNNLMQAARQWRYHALAEWCRNNEVLHCLVAHHEGDQLETALLGGARGVTADGGAGMSAIRLYRGIRFLRPLLQVPKDELKNFLIAKKIEWIEDPTNTREEFARTRMRQQLEQMDLPAARATVALHAIDRMQREQRGAEAAMRCMVVHPAGYITLHRRAWLALDLPLRSQLLADAITAVGGHIHRPRQHETAWLESTMHEVSGKQTLGNCLIEWKGDAATIAREPERVEPPVTMKGADSFLWDQRFRIHHHLAEPLTLGALGAVGRKQSGINAPLATPALWHLDELHSIPHIAWAGAKPLDPTQFRLGFAPAKPLAARGFWWFTAAPDAI